MGMDIYGKNPISKEGSYFRNTISWWHPLANYCWEIAPEITEGCKHWHSNDGDGLDADGARALAEKLKSEIDAGRTQQYERRYARAQNEVPKRRCNFCGGTGIRKPNPRPFDVENVQAFINFLKDCGGFLIW